MAGRICYLLAFPATKKNYKTCHTSKPTLISSWLSFSSLTTHSINQKFHLLSCDIVLDKSSFTCSAQVFGRFSSRVHLFSHQSRSRSSSIISLSLSVNKSPAILNHHYHHHHHHHHHLLSSSIALLMQVVRNLYDAFVRGVSVFQYSPRALHLVWQTSSILTLNIAIVTVFLGFLPAAVAYAGKLIVDSVIQNRDVVAATITAFLASSSTASSISYSSSFSSSTSATLSAEQTRQYLRQPIMYVILEAILICIRDAAQKILNINQNILKLVLGEKINILILEKAKTFELVQFEDSELQDKMLNARREASSRPLSLVYGTFQLIQSGISMFSFGGLLLSFSPMAVVVLLVAALPSFFAETSFSGEIFRLFRWRTPETRQRNYIETLLTKDDYAKEIKLFNLSDMLLERYCAIYEKFITEDKQLAVKRDFWRFVLGLISTIAFYSAYAWIVKETVLGHITLGDLTMYVMVFRQGQSTFSNILTTIGGMYEDNLYLSNLYEFLETPTITVKDGQQKVGPCPGDGIRFENVSFTYAGRDQPALQNISLHLRPGEKLAIVGENGSGKTTLIKLLSKLYSPSSGRILLDGLDLEEWHLPTLHRRIGVIFQNFVHYQFSAGENIGIGDVDDLENNGRWKEAAIKGQADPFISHFPEQYQTQLGRWFKTGIELSGGQWQKIALSRAFMRRDADILVLDEPTAAMDPQAEYDIFEQFRAETKNQMVFLISHRFSTVRMADRILVIDAGKIVEQGSHDQLVALGGRYANLFELQARGFR